MSTVLGKLPPCPGRAKLDASPAVNADKTVKDHLSFWQTQRFLDSNKHQVILLASHFCSFQLGKLLLPCADKHSVQGASQCLSVPGLSSPAHGERKYHPKNQWENRNTCIKPSCLKALLVPGTFGSRYGLWLWSMAFALGDWMQVKLSWQRASHFRLL